MEDKSPGWHWLNTVIMVLEGGCRGYTGFTGAHAPNVEPFCGAYRPVLFPPGMLEGITPLILLIVLKDSEAKTDILGKGNTTSDTGRLMDAGRPGAKSDKEVRGDVRGDTDPDTGVRGVEINVSDGNLTGHTIQAGSGKALSCMPLSVGPDRITRSRWKTGYRSPGLPC